MTPIGCCGCLCTFFLIVTNNFASISARRCDASGWWLAGPSLCSLQGQTMVVYGLLFPCFCFDYIALMRSLSSRDQGFWMANSASMMMTMMMMEPLEPHVSQRTFAKTSETYMLPVAITTWSVYDPLPSGWSSVTTWLVSENFVTYWAFAPMLLAGCSAWAQLVSTLAGWSHFIVSKVCRYCREETLQHLATKGWVYRT